MDTAAGLVLQGGDAALLVAGGGVLVHRLMVAQEVILEAVEHVGRFIKGLAADAAAQQHALRAEHLRHLGEHRAAAPGDHHIAEGTHSGVGSDAGQAVGAAALHADDQVADGNGLPVELAGVGGALLQQLTPSGKLVLHLLTGEELHPVGIIGAKLLHKLVVLEVLAAQAQHQDGAGVGVAGQGGQQLAGLGMIGASLAAPIGVGEGIQAINAAAYQVLVVGHQLLGHIVDAAHGGDDPDLIADRGPAVLAAVALEGLGRDRGDLRHGRLVG